MPKAFKNSKEVYIYPAVFTYDDDGISIEFPDLPGCLSCADTDEEAVLHAKEALSLYLYDAEETKRTISTPTPISQIPTNENQQIFSIDVWMPYHRAKIEDCYVKKTVTIPQWLNILAENHNVNFSQILQKALKDYLGIYE